MALKRLPNNVQSLLCASAQVNSYERAIAELIYNSLDADSTSIAIRIHILDSKIQVIDNGYGVTKHDFNVIGQRHMTSKLTDVATLKAAPKNYGYRGEFLSNIITVSQMVKITSRHVSTEETWAKTFSNGKEKKFVKMTTRPTKGTTVDIKGFLYNLNIQKRGIDPINEMLNVKLFLEQLSLVHNNISVSLRDDSQNEIVFKIHKKRDIYQTLSTLFGIDKGDVQELQVEKHEYKVKGLIGKTDKDLDLHWIYLNGKCIHSSSKLHKIINEYFKKSLRIKDQRRLKSKKNTDEHGLFNRNIPFYFIFVTCPYIDYDISYTEKQSVIEFKNWEQMNKLLEKLVKFYVGDVNLNEVKKTKNKLIYQEQINIKVKQDTRDQVKKIMDKILGSNSKKLGVSQLQNGVKGKLIKRKVKKKTKRSTNITKIFLQTDNKHIVGNNASSSSKADHIPERNIEQHTQDTVKNLDTTKELVTIIPKNHATNSKIPDQKKCTFKEIPINKKKKEIISKILTPTKKTYKTTKKQKHTLNKHKRPKANNNEIKYLKHTDSVYKKSKMVAQKAEEFLQHHTKKRNAILNHHIDNAKKNCKKNTYLRKKYCAINNNNIPLPPKTNKHIIQEYIMKKLKTKSYKTTYDLVQTVLKSQQQLLNAEEDNMSEEFHKELYKRNYTLHCMPKVSKRYTWTNKYISREYSDIDNIQEIPQYSTDIPTQYKTFENKDKFSEYHSPYGEEEISDIMSNIPERFKLIHKDINNENKNINYTHKETSYCTLSGPFRVLTYDSHQYHNDEVFHNCYTNRKRQNIRFITKESRDNFATTNDLRTLFRKPSKSVSKKKTKTYDIRVRQSINESLYTIKYSKSNDTNYNIAHKDILANSMDNIKKVNYFENQGNENYENVLPINYFKPDFGSTYTIHPSISPFDINIKTQNQSRQNIESNELFETYSIHDSNSEVNNDNNGSKDNFTHHRKNFNIMFVSKSQRSETETSLDNNNIIEPLNVCETVFQEIGSDEREFAISFNENNRLNDSLYDNFDNIDGGIGIQIENELDEIIQGENTTENVSHHFSSAVKTKQPRVFNKTYENNTLDPIPIDRNQKDNISSMIRAEDLAHIDSGGNIDAENIDCNFEITNFNLKNRLRFIPKGMSQIFENCHTKTACDYNLDKDYYEDSIYNNFANDVQVNTEIYEPIIQNVEDLTTKNIHKFQNKLKKENASLIFDETSLKEAKVLGQADCKFIAAIMRKRCSQSNDGTEYLILFDQHAVHERIRLETNLADYVIKERWTSIIVDNIILKMSKDEILYLHNYKDKFTQLGLQWTILNDNEVTVHSIPEAILGKNAREVEKVIKAVRNLIIEEITVMKLQKGCVSLYPKLIMDLVFSEACRYAIKFGDPLSKNDCVELLNALSNCKTPFQCAHGRPVMAVIMDIKSDKPVFKINMEKIRRFKQRGQSLK